jgi:Arc/MetJ-type ribon-helix-helix transcriptional regulator
MTRFSVSLSDDLSEWVEDRASSRNVSKAQVIRDAVELAKESDAAKGGDISVVQSGEVVERLDELEARVAELESRGSPSVVTEAAESARAPTERDSSSQPPASSGQSSTSDTLDVDVSDDVVAAVETVADNWEDAPDRLQARKNAAAKILQHALDTGNAVGKSSDIVEQVRDQHPVEGQNAETFYRKNIRPTLKEYGTYSQGKHGYVVSDDWYARNEGWEKDLTDLSDDQEQ